MTGAVRLTRRGRGVVLCGCALLLTGWITQIQVAVAAGVFALAVSGTAVAWVAIRRRTVRIRRTVPPATSAVGRELPTAAAITVGGPGFGPAVVTGLAPDGTDAPAPDGERGRRDPVVRLDRREVLVGRACVPRRRGLLEWPRLSVELPDPLGIAVGVCRAPASGRTVVFPRTVPVGRFGPGMLAGGSDPDRGPGTRRAPGDPGPVPRAFQTGDQLRQMHWPATARAGKPMVRAEEPRPARTAVIAIDCSPTGYRDPEGFERAITACASICEQLLGQGWSIRVQTAQGRQLTDPPWLFGPDGRLRLLSALALLQRDSPGARSPAGVGDAAILVHGAHGGPAPRPVLSLCTEAPGGGDRPGTLIWDGSAPLSSVWAAASRQGAVP